MIEATQTVNIDRVRPLTLEEKEAARTRAIEAVRGSTGEAPRREQFAKQKLSKYPAAFSITVFALCLLVLVAAFTPSAIRLFHAGQNMALDSLHDVQSAIAIGAAGVLLAEFAQVVSTLALAMVSTRTQQGILLCTAALATAFAVVGNIYIANPLNYGDLLTWEVAFAWIEAFAPPVVVLAMSYVLKRQVLDAIADRRYADLQFETAYASWQEAVLANPEEHRNWSRFYIEALQSAIRQANSRMLTREEWNLLPRQVWILLVQREMQSMSLHLDVQRAQEQEEARRQLAESVAPKSGGGGGQHTGAVEEAAKRAQISQTGAVTLACPVCSEQVSKPTLLQAKRALAAHSRKHVNEAKATSEQQHDGA